MNQRDEFYQILTEREGKKLVREIHETNRLLHTLIGILNPRKAKSATLNIGESMPATIQLNGSGFSAAPPAFLEFDGPNGTGNQVAPIGPLSYASDNSAVATVDPNTGAGTAVSVGSANITVTDTGNGLSASDVITVTDTAVSATLNLIANPAPVAGSPAAAALKAARK